MIEKPTTKHSKSKRVATLAIVVILSLCTISVEADRKIMRDSLDYQDNEQMRTIWQPAMGEEFAPLLQRSEQGVQLTDISGDCWSDTNTQRAVFLCQPALKAPAYIQVEVSEFVPEDRYAQVGLVAWADEDNYIRNTIGFCPPGSEALAEFNGRTSSQGIYSSYPRGDSQRCLLRFDILNNAIRCYLSYDARHWYCTGGFTLPNSRTVGEFFKGFGLLGVGGRMKQAPQFTNWEKGPLPRYRDDDFSDSVIGDHWTLGQTNGSWCSEQVQYYQNNGMLSIHPFSGSDIYLYYEQYPFAAMETPRANSWEIEIKLVAFNPQAKGLWNKAGIVFWEDNRHYLCEAVVADQEEDQMYFEVLACGASTSKGLAIINEGFQERTVTDVYFRIGKVSPGHFHLQASYNEKTWHSLGSFSAPFNNPQIRLFASGDVNIQYPEDYDFSASFDYVKRLRNQQEKGTK